MVHQFRKEVRTAKRAAMGEMYQLARENLKAGEKLINFASGHPASETFPDKLIRKYISQAVEKYNDSPFQYDPAGYVPLRKVLKEFANHNGCTVKPEDDLLVTHGSTEAVYLAASAFVNRGDKVIVENPSYVNALKAFALLGAEIIGVPVEEDGVNIDALENAMKCEGRVCLFYTIPNFANPSGITMSCQKRRAVYDLSVKYNVLILEDNIYGELRYQCERIPNIKEFDTEGTVLYIGSVSKVIAPAMRIGFITADKEVIKHVLPMKEVLTGEDSYVMQYALWKMLEENDIYAQIRKICDVYAHKLFLMEECMDRLFPPNIKRSSPDGGMYLWVTLPDGSDVEQFCRESAIRLHIPITPGNEFCVVRPEKCTSMRFNFVKESMEDIERGIKEIGKLMKQYL